MAANQPLTGIALIDCAKANAAQGVAEAARLCGYDGNVDGFRQALTRAGEDMGVVLDDLNDLITDQSVAKRTAVIDVAPDSPQNL
ncbi:MAG: hypothetical protein AAF810_25450 [Cyanobacteria bacterium P01_D01_bin.36]